MLTSKKFKSDTKNTQSSTFTKLVSEFLIYSIDQQQQQLKQQQPEQKFCNNTRAKFKDLTTNNLIICQSFFSFPKVQENKLDKKI